MKNLEVFNEIRNKLNSVVEINKGLKIEGVDDKEGYAKVKQAKKEIREEEISLEKLAKSERQQALEYQRGIIALEKDLKEVTSPVIKDYDTQLKEIDELVAREERKVLLPHRRKLLEQVEYSLSDEDILNINEKEWAEFIGRKREEYLEIKANEKREKERKEQEDERVEKAKKEAADKAIKEVNEIAKEEKDKEAQRIVQEHADKEAERVAMLKEEKIQEWLKANNYNDKDFKLVEFENKIILYKKVSEYLR